MSETTALEDDLHLQNDDLQRAIVPFRRDAAATGPRPRSTRPARSKSDVVRSAPQLRDRIGDADGTTASFRSCDEAWFDGRLPRLGPQIEGHEFQFPDADRDDLLWDWRWTSNDAWVWIIARREGEPARGPEAGQLLGWFQGTADAVADPAERLWSLNDALYRTDPGNRWEALIGVLDVRAASLSIGWVGGFEGLVWDVERTLRAIVPAPGALGSDAMPDPMTLRLNWTGRVSLGVGPSRNDGSSFERDARARLPFQVHRTNGRR